MGKQSSALFLIALSILLGNVVSSPALADTIGELRDQISERSKAIADLEKEIATYQVELDTVGKESKTLQGAIRNIDLQQRKLSAEIKVTENKIARVTLTIEGLTDDIADKEVHIKNNRGAMAETIRAMNEKESESLIEALLSGQPLSTLWQQLDQLERFQVSVKADLSETTELKTGLEETRKKNEESRLQLLNLKGQLSDQTQLLAQNKKAKNTLLTSTKSKESEYKRLLAKKVALRNAFEQELLEFESRLRLEIDPTSLPKTGSGVLKWPVDAVKVTQEFGDTAFARSGAYNGRGHNGIDLRANTGTRIKASLNGKVAGIGNTDAVCPGASYGKWVLIEHENGLTTLYAHLSLIKVETGQQVQTGEVIGYGGETGYATGPHLHFTVYATQGVKILQRKSAVCGGTYTMPIADLKAYLNPLSYL